VLSAYDSRTHQARRKNLCWFVWEVCVGRFVSGEFVLGRAIDIAVLRCMRIVRHSSSHQYLAERFVLVVV
jgi:hypothetical protein